jgi:cob(I)alamin adenosyltransferase
VKLYTRTGDAGETSLFDGTRVKKDDARVDAYGEVDELNAWLGFARSSLAEPDLADELGRIQRDLFAIGARLADPAAKIAERVAKAAITDDDVGRLERLIDRLELELKPLRHFILAGGTPPGAALHVARAVCRRAERRIVSLQPIESILVRYMNRLSDALFVMARVINRRAGAPEVEW